MRVEQVATCRGIRTIGTALKNHAHIPTGDADEVACLEHINLRRARQFRDDYLPSVPSNRSDAGLGEAAIIGVDLAEKVFHLHGASADGSVDCAGCVVSGHNK